MGKLTINGKDLTKPFTLDGKKYVKLTLKSGFGANDGKVISLKTTPNFPTIKESQYDLIGSDGSHVNAITIVSQSAIPKVDTTQPFIIEFKNDYSITVGTSHNGGETVSGIIIKNMVDRTEWSVTIWAKGYSDGQTVDFVEGNAYQFEEEKPVIDLGKY